MAKRQMFGTNPGEEAQEFEDKLGLTNKQAPEEQAASKGEPVNQQAARQGNGNQATKQRQTQQNQQNQGQQNRTRNINNKNRNKQQRFKQSQNNQQQQNNQQNDKQQAQQQNNQSQTEDEQQSKVTSESEYDTKVEYVRDKFNNPEEFEQSIEELEEKLGVDENVSINSEQEAIDYYIQLEEEMGNIGQKTGNVDNTVRQNQKLEQQLQRQNNTIRRLRTMLRNKNNQPNNNQSNNTQPRDNMGRFTSNTQQQPNNQQSNINQNNQPQNQNNQNAQQNIGDILDKVNIDMDPKEFTSEMYKDGANSKKFKEAVAKINNQVPNPEVQNLKQEVQTLKQQMQQRQQQEQQQQQARQTHQQLQQKMNNLKQKYGEQEVERNKQDLLSFFRQYPVYLNVMPNGIERAYEEVRQNNQQFQQQQQQQQQQNKENLARKQSANIPDNGNSGRRFAQNSQNMNYEDKVKSQIFGGDQQSAGWWG